MKYEVENGGIKLNLTLTASELQALKNFFSVAIDTMEDQYTRQGIEDEGLELAEIIWEC